MLFIQKFRYQLELLSSIVYIMFFSSEIDHVKSTVSVAFAIIQFRLKLRDAS